VTRRCQLNRSVQLGAKSCAQEIEKAVDTSVTLVAPFHLPDPRDVQHFLDDSKEMNEGIKQVNARENWGKEWLWGIEHNPADVALRSREDGYRGLAPSDPTAHRSLAPEAIAADESSTRGCQLGIRDRVLVAL
jgi:hypothetical protein